MMTSRDDDGYDAPKQREDVQRKKRSSSSSFLSRAKSCGAGLMLMRGLMLPASRYCRYVGTFVATVAKYTNSYVGILYKKFYSRELKNLFT